MARTRLELDALLRSTLGTSNVYFDPPESFKLKYPCIVYSFSGLMGSHADNDRYITYKRYMLNYITPDADDSMVDTIEALPFCRLSSPYVADGLFHNPYEIDF